MASELKPSSVDFGVVIAFVAPGFVAFQAVSYHMPTAKAWMAAASQSDQSVGVFLFVLLASLSLGLFVSGVRALVIDNLLYACLLGKHAVPRPALDWSKVDDKKLLVLVTIRDSHYRHYQFYSNTLVALVFWTLARSYSTAPSLPLPWQQLALIAIGVFALLLSSRDSLLRYVKAIQQLFQL